MCKSKIAFLAGSLLIGSLAWSLSLKESIALVKKAPLVKAAEAQHNAYKHLYEAQKGANYPSLDLSYSGRYLKDKPLLYLDSSLSFLPPGTGSIQLQAQKQYKGSIRLTYPLFSGFAISSLIDKAKLEAQKAALKSADTKRNLYLNVVELYARAFTLKKLENAQQRAYEATEKSYKKAKAFFDLGMIAESQLLRLDAALHSIDSQCIATKNEYKMTLTQLSSLLHTEVKKVNNLPKTQKVSLGRLTQEALQKRPDLLVLKKSVQEQDAQISLAKSGYYPTVALFVEAAQIGDTGALNGDAFTNKDRSAAGFVLQYNLFNGFETSDKLQAAKATKLGAIAMLTSYEDRVKSELKRSYLAYNSLLAQKEATVAQLHSQKNYEKLIEGEFENQLTDADKLSRAIAATAMAQAELSAIEAKLYTSYASLLLEVDNETFLTTFKGRDND